MSVSPQSNKTARSTDGYATRALARRILWALLALAPVTILVNYVTHADKVLLFLLSCAALIPLAWLIGEATEHAAEHTGPGIGGFLNASFGNAPELIIALFAIHSGLPQVVRGSLAGSRDLEPAARVRHCAARWARRRADRQALAPRSAGTLRRRSPARAAGDRARLHGLTRAACRRRRLDSDRDRAARALSRRDDSQSPTALAAERSAPAPGAWTLPRSLAALAVATALTAVVSEILVHSLDAFAKAVGASEFFIAAVIVAIVGNAAEHGGAVVIARAGKMKLASEIAISSSAQVALLVTPAVMLLSLFFSHSLPLEFPLGGGRRDGCRCRS